VFRNPSRSSMMPNSSVTARAAAPLRPFTLSSRLVVSFSA
jgi:hypothetical protein